MATDEAENLTMQILGVGACAGLRTMSAPALTAAHLHRHGAAGLEGTPFAWLASGQAVAVARLLAAGELAGDKIPDIPARIEPLPLAGRALSGALSGLVLSAAYRGSRKKGAILGGIAAVASAFVAYHLRKALVEEIGLPDPLVALLEDSLVLGGGRRLMEL